MPIVGIIEGVGSSSGPVTTEARAGSGSSASRRSFGVVDVLTVYLVLLVGVPATLVVGPLGGAGNPATLLGVGCFVWWALARVDRRLGLGRAPHAMHLVVAGFAAAMACGYGMAALRAAHAIEVRSADRAMIKMIAGIGVLLLVADGIRDRAELDRLLRRIGVAAGVLATFGLVQFVFGIEINTYIKVPGLESLNPAQLIQQRSVFRRVSGTTSHPIEFGVTLSMLLPIALHAALTAKAHRSRYWLAAIAVAAAIPTSISRSAMLGLGLSWAVLIVGWDQRRRLNALIVTPFAVALMRLAVPGLLGTIKSLFTGLKNDPSYLGRTEDYEFVRRYIEESRWFGRGLGTFIPEVYTTLDNQYLGQIVETGYVGLAALVILLGSGVVLGWRIKRQARDPDERSLGVALSAAAIVPLSTFITFDGLSFPVVTGFAFLVLGCAAAARRLCLRVAAEDSPRPSTLTGVPASPSSSFVDPYERRYTE